MSPITDNSEVYELIQGIRMGEEDAMERLLATYDPLISAKVSKYSYILDEDEIRQLCAIGLFEAAQSYSAEKARGEVTFGLYAKMCIRNRIISEIRRLGPTDKQVEMDVFTDTGSMEEDVINRQDLYMQVNRARKKLTAFEDKVLRLYLRLGSYDEVARVLCKSRKSVDNALSRIRSKFRDVQ